MSAADHAAADLAPLRRRLGLLQILRSGLTATITAAALVFPGWLGDRPVGSLLAASALYAAVTGAAELARRRSGIRSAALTTGLVLLDGIYLAVAMSMTGGAASPLSFLVLVHVIAVTLLLSFRSGLKTALWHALLLFAVAWLQLAEVVGEAPTGEPGDAAGVKALGLLAVAIAAAAFSSLNERELRRGKAELRALAAMAARLASSRDRSHLVDALLGGVSDAFGFPRAAVVVRDATCYRAFVRTPDGGGGVSEVADAPSCDGVLTTHGKSPAPVLVRSLDPVGDPLLSTAIPDARNVVVLPFVIEGEMFGALAVERAGGSGTQIARRTADLLAQFATHAALALKAAALQAEVLRLADTDGLTGLANRRVFQQALSRELTLAHRRGEPCTLVLLDVDHFKAVNDTHGHPAGDEVLRVVGRALLDTARGTDVAARYGGEEFALILPSCSAAEARVVAERFRTAVAADPGPVPVTVSAGVATYPQDAEGEASLIAAADHALYRAKRTGRDRVVRYRRPRRVSRSAAQAAGRAPAMAATIC